MSVERSASAAAVDADSLVSSDAPWPGLAPFTEDQSGFFHGRDQEIRALARLMERKALTVLFGQSGLGKSSLLQAGVFPRLRAAGFCPIYIRLDHSDGAPSPSEQVKAIVAAETARVGTWTKPGIAQPGESLWEYFHHRDDRLINASGRAIVPVLVFDQFEELFTLGAARSTTSDPAAGAQRDRAVAFMSELAELVENRPSEQLVARLDESSAEMDAFDFSRTDYRVCISLREDYLPHLEGLKTIMPALMENRMRLTRMTGSQALEAVLNPGGALVTEEVARAIVEFVAGARGGSVERLAELDVEPPLLSVICRELNDRRRALGQAQISADLVTGNRREILHDFCERSVADLPEPMRRFVEDKLLTKSGFRDNLALETALEESGVTKPLIDTLVSRRLLRIEDRIGTQRVELTHDVLADVVRASRDARQQRLALEQAQAREQAAAAAAAHRNRRMRLIIAGLAAAVVALLVGAFFGLRAQRRAEAAQREAAAQSSRTDFVFGSELLEQDKVPAGLAYLVRAARSDPANHSVGPRLISELVGRSFAVPIGEPLVQGTPILRAAYSPDGRHAVTEERHGTIILWDLGTGTAERKITVDVMRSVIGSGPFDVNPSVTAYAHGDASGLVQVSSLATGRPLFPPLQTGTEVESLGYSPDGRWLVAGNADSKLRIWDAHTGELKATIDEGREAYALGFDAGSTRMVATSHARGIWRVWQLPGGQPLTDWIKTPNGYANVAAFSPDGKLLAITDNRGAQLYDATTGATVGARMAHTGPAYDVAFSHDGKLLVTTSNDATARLWEVPSGAPHLAPLAHGDRTSTAMFSRDDRLLLTACADGVARLWDVTTGRPACEPIRVGNVLCAVLSPDGSEFLTAGVDGIVRRWSTKPGAARALVMSTTRDTTSFTVGSNDATVGWTVSGNRLQRFDLLTGRLVGQPRLLPATVTAGRLSPDAKRLIVRTGDTAEVWDLLSSPIRRMPLEEPGEANQRVWITVDSRYLLGLKDAETMRIWDLGTGQLELHVPHASRYFAYCAATHRLALQVNGRFVQLYDLATGQRVGDPLPQQGPVSAVAFSQDGWLMACGTGVGQVQLWNVRTGQPIGEPWELRGLVRNVEFSEDGRRLLTGTPSETRVWDVATRAPMTEPMVGGNDIMLAAFVPATSSQRIITIARTKNELRIWDAASGELISEPMHRHVPGTDGAVFGSAEFIGLMARDGRGMHLEMVSLPPPAAPVPEWLLQLATALAGGELDRAGVLRMVPFAPSRLADLRRALAALPDNAPYVEWGRWFLADRATRSIAPGFTITPAEADKLAQETAAPATTEPLTTTGVP